MDAEQTPPAPTLEPIFVPESEKQKAEPKKHPLSQSSQAVPTATAMFAIATTEAETEVGVEVPVVVDQSEGPVSAVPTASATQREALMLYIIDFGLGLAVPTASATQTHGWVRRHVVAIAALVLVLIVGVTLWFNLQPASTPDNANPQTVGEEPDATRPSLPVMDEVRFSPGQNAELDAYVRRELNLALSAGQHSKDIRSDDTRPFQAVFDTQYEKAFILQARWSQVSNEPASRLVRYEFEGTTVAGYMLLRRGPKTFRWEAQRKINLHVFQNPWKDRPEYFGIFLSQKSLDWLQKQPTPWLGFNDGGGFVLRMIPEKSVDRNDPLIIAALAIENSEGLQDWETVLPPLPTQTPKSEKQP